MTESELKQEIEGFAARVRGLELPALESRRIEEFRQKGGSLGHHMGIYAFLIGDKVHYVGKATGRTVRQRVQENARARGDPKWDAVLDDPSVRVVFCRFEEKDSFWIPALEAMLIQRAGTPINKRVG